MPLLEAIEQRAASLGLPVDSRVARGRSYRDALRRLLEKEHFDRIIVSVPESERSGLTHDDLLWLIDRVPAEIMLLRPARDDARRISAVSGILRTPAASQQDTQTSPQGSMDRDSEFRDQGSLALRRDHPPRPCRGHQKLAPRSLRLRAQRRGQMGQIQLRRLNMTNSASDTAIIRASA
jgi:hypothetical protein